MLSWKISTKYFFEERLFSRIWIRLILAQFNKFLISKSLKLKGIKPTNFLTDIIKSKIKELKNIEVPIELDIESDIDNVLLKLGYKKTNNTFTIETKTISNVNNN